ncbi:MAG: HAD family hydrolase [Desulfovibrionaceae bacterium]
MNDIVLIVFDFDGTLAHTLPAVAAGMRRTFHDFGRTPPDEADVARIIGLPAAECFTAFAPDLSHEQALVWVEHYRSVYPQFEGLARLFHGAADTLRLLRQAGYALASASNKGEAVLQANAAAFGVSDQFDLLVGDKPGAPAKPDPRVLTERVWPRFPQAGPASTLVVGDAVPDMALARASGARAVLAGWGYGNREACLQYEPATVLENIRDLPGILKT